MIPPPLARRRYSARAMDPHRPRARPNLWLLIGITALALVIAALVLVATAL